MASAKHDTDKVKEQQTKKPYEPPAIVRQGVISTRAGSPVRISDDSDPNAIDPADLFGNGN